MGVYLKKYLWHLSILLIAFLLALVMVSFYSSINGNQSLEFIRKYLLNLLSGSLGESSYGTKVSSEIICLIPRTLTLTTFSILFGTIIGILIGMLFAFKGGKGKNTAQVFITTIPISMPEVLVILSLQLLMIKLRKSGFPVLPIMGNVNFPGSVLPILSLSIIPIFFMARITFSMAVTAYTQKFILMARAKGNSEMRIHWVHVWRSIREPVYKSGLGMIPIIISNLLIIEKLFMFPGLAYNLFKALTRRDINLFMGMTLGLVLVYISAFLILKSFSLLDILYRRRKVL